MRLTTLLLLTVPISANYPSQVSVLLDAGATSLTVHHTGTGGIGCNGESASADCVLTFSPGAGRRVRFSITPGIHVPPPAGTTYATCANPCTVNVDRNWGMPYEFYEYVDNSGNPLTPRLIGYPPSAYASGVCGGPGTLPQVELSTVTTAPLPMPIEVIGQDCYVTRVQVPLVPGHASTSLRFYIRIHSPGYNNASKPDGKISVQLGSAAWMTLDNAHATGIDEMRFYGPGGAGIGSYPQVREFTLSVPDGTIQSGDTTVTVGFRFNGTEGNGSGSRILAFNIIEANKTITSIDVASNVATAHSTSNGYSTLNTVLIQNAPGMYMRFNGFRQVTAATDTFSFTPCGSTPTSTTGCTSPDATGVAPPVSRDTSSYAGTAQAVMYAARCIIAKSAFTAAIPDSAAPSGGDATRGEKLFKFGQASGVAGTDLLVNPNLAYLSNTLHYGTCGGASGCHPSNGSDLKVFNYSNHAIERRSEFHGFTLQDGKDIAAYIRGISATACTQGRPWNPPVQPGPGQSTASAADFFCGAGIDAVLTYGYADFTEYLGTSSAPLLWDQRVEPRDLPIPWQMGGWAQWLPVVYPADAFPSATTPFLSSTPYTAYRDIIDNMTPNNFSAFQTYNYGGISSVQTLYGGLSDWMIEQGTPLNNAAGNVPPAIFPTLRFSIQQFYLKAMWEIAIEKQTFAFDGQRVNAVYGASGNVNWPIANGVPGNGAFNTGMHRIEMATGLYDVTRRPPFDPSVGYNTYLYQSNIWYVLQAILGANNGWDSPQAPLDNAYLNAFLSAIQGARPTGFAGWWFAQIFSPQAGNAQSNFWMHAGSNNGTDWTALWSVFLNYDRRYSYWWMSSSEWTTFINNSLDMLNSITAAHTAAYWDSVFTSLSDNTCTVKTAWDQSTGAPCANTGMFLTLFKVWGANSTKLATFLAWAKTIPSWSGHNFDADITAANDAAGGNGGCTIGGAPNYTFGAPFGGPYTTPIWWRCSNMQ